MFKRSTDSYGFTIVELLIVVVVIAVLAAVTIVGFNGVQARAQSSKVSSDIALFVKSIHQARINTDKRLGSITNSNCSKCTCPYTNGDMTIYSTLPKTHTCWITYYNSLSAIATASGTDLSGLRDGDPWGSPYMLDENEGENGGCGKDQLSSVGKSGTSNGGTIMAITSIALFTPQCY